VVLVYEAAVGSLKHDLVAASRLGTRRAPVATTDMILDSGRTGSQNDPTVTNSRMAMSSTLGAVAHLATPITRRREQPADPVQETPW
jgi:hypothetical protein